MLLRTAIEFTLVVLTIWGFARRDFLLKLENAIIWHIQKSIKERNK